MELVSNKETRYLLQLCLFLAEDLESESDLRETTVPSSMSADKQEPKANTQVRRTDSGLVEPLPRSQVSFSFLREEEKGTWERSWRSKVSPFVRSSYNSRMNVVIAH